MFGGKAILFTVKRLAVAGLVAAMGAATAHAVKIGEENRATLPDYARNLGIAAAALDKRYGATGLLQCGGTVGTAQLTVKANVITTAAHVLFNRSGRPRSDLSTCRFKIRTGAGWRQYRIEPDSVQCGSRKPYSNSGVKDWAVMRLSEPVAGVRPYQIGSRGAGAVDFLAHDHDNWSPKRTKSIENCRIRGGGPSAGGVREIQFDCDTGNGASGAALLAPGSATMIGIFVGYRSTHPSRAAPFSSLHYNYGVTISGEFRRAILNTAR